MSQQANRAFDKEVVGHAVSRLLEAVYDEPVRITVEFGDARKEPTPLVVAVVGVEAKSAPWAKAAVTVRESEKVVGLAFIPAGAQEGVPAHDFDGETVVNIRADAGDKIFTFLKGQIPAVAALAKTLDEDEV